MRLLVVCPRIRLWQVTEPFADWLHQSHRKAFQAHYLPLSRSSELVSLLLTGTVKWPGAILSYDAALLIPWDNDVCSSDVALQTSALECACVIF